MKKMQWLCLFALLLAVKSFSQPAFVKDSLDNFINREMQKWQVPGLAVAIIKDGKTVVMKGYGVRQLGKPEKVDENTLFMIGSNSKAFTGTTLALLEAEKKLSLDDKIKKYLPWFKFYDDCVTEQVTIRDMLCHRSGLLTFQGDFTYWESDLTRRQVVEKFGKNKPKYPFRTQYGYCNAGFATAGEVIPVVTGKLWEEMVKEKIFMPLGMNRTVALTADFPKQENICAAHTVVDGKLIQIPHCQVDNLSAAGSIGSSVKDISKWLMMQLDTGKVDGKLLFDKNAIMKTWAGNTVVSSRKSRLFPTHFGMYGLGWFLQDYAGKEIIQHSGGVNGFVTQTCFVPEERLAIIVFTNTDQNALYQALMYQILDAYMGQPYQNYSQVFHQFQAESDKADQERIKKEREIITKKPKPALDLVNYTGKYTNEVYGEMEIKLENKKLVMHFSHHPKLTANLDAKGGNDFLGTFSDPVMGVHTFPFTVEEGKIKSVSVKVNDFIEYEPYVFQKQN